MKKANQYQYFGLYLLTLSAVMAAPVNDGFNNRTRVQGARAEMAGSFSGATVDAGEPSTYGGDASVWWSWVAPESGLVLLESGSPAGSGMACVTTATSVENIATPNERVTTMPIGQKRYATFQAVAGKEYQIGAFGLAANTDEFQLRLSVTNAPIILEGPVTQTISPGGSALFTVAVAVAESGRARIQWQFEGTDIANESGPTLARTNATASMAGEYRAIVTHTDSAGNLTVRTSSVARLTVSVPQTPRLLLSEDPAEPGVLLVSVVGEPARSYDLGVFRSLPEQRIPSIPYVASACTSESPVRIPTDQKQLFFHVRAFEPISPTCWLNLKRIRFAKQRVAADLKMPGAAPFAVSLVHDRLGYVPQCPEGGTYTYGSMDVYPTCSLTGHLLGDNLGD